MEKLLQAVNEAMLLKADASFRDALRIYGSLQEQARNCVNGARDLFRALFAFFAKNRKNPNDEPTEAQIERDVDSILHGHKDGEIVIRHEAPHTIGGVHEVIDNVHKDKSAFKASVEESEKEWGMANLFISRANYIGDAKARRTPRVARN